MKGWLHFKGLEFTVHVTCMHSLHAHINIGWQALDALQCQVAASSSPKTGLRQHGHRGGLEDASRSV